MSDRLRPRIRRGMGRWVVIAMVPESTPDAAADKWLDANGAIVTAPERMTDHRATKVALDYLGVNR